MSRTRDAIVALGLVSAGEALVVYLVAPQYMLSNNFSRSILRLVILNVVAYAFYSHFIYPFFFSPLRDLPRPKVNTSCPDVDVNSSSFCRRTSCTAISSRH
jgi:hypothetical protein